MCRADDLGRQSTGLMHVAMKYVWIGLVLAAIAAVEAFHHLSSSEPVDLVCAAPETKHGARSEALLRHLTGH